MEAMMARDDRSRTDKGRVKFRYVEFELDGSDTTLQESLRNIATAIMRGPNVVRSVSVPPGKLTKGSAEGVESQIEEAIEVPPEDQAEAEYADQHSSTGPRQSPRKPPNPKVLEIDLKTGEMPLKNFIEKISPDSVNERYLAIAYWFKQYQATADVTMDHIFTAYRHMDWRTPKDVTQPLRDMKSKNAWFNKGQAKGAYAINHVGEEQVLEMIRKKEQG